MWNKMDNISIATIFTKSVYWQYTQSVINIDFINKCVIVIACVCKIYLFNDGLTCVDVTVVLARYVLSLCVCLAVWRVSLCWLERTVGWVHWSSVHRLISSIVVAIACKMIPSSSINFPFPLAFNNCMVRSVLTYLCLILGMCNACAEIGLFVFIYRNMFTVSYFNWASSLANVCFVTHFTL